VLGFSGGAPGTEAPTWLIQSAATRRGQTLAACACAPRSCIRQRRDTRRRRGAAALVHGGAAARLRRRGRSRRAGPTDRHRAHRPGCRARLRPGGAPARPRCAHPGAAPCAAAYRRAWRGEFDRAIRCSRMRCRGHRAGCLACLPRTRQERCLLCAGRGPGSGHATEQALRGGSPNEGRVGCTGRVDPNPSAERRRPAARADGSFLAHISRETGAAVALRGRGAGGADEGPAPLHLAVAAPSAQAAGAARRLVQSLVDTVRRDHSAAAPAQPQGVGSGFPQARAQLPCTASAVGCRLEAWRACSSRQPGLLTESWACARRHSFCLTATAAAPSNQHYARLWLAASQEWPVALAGCPL